MKLDLSQRRALVCGASQGIGRASAQALAELGASVIAAARDEAALRTVAADLPGGAGRHSWLRIDLADSEAAAGAVAALVQRDGPIEILINNAGGPPPGPIVDARPGDFTAAMAVHLHAAHRLVQTLLPGMRARRYGRIINIISTSVREPIPGLGVSNTTRAAMAGWSKTLARELAPDGITVNNVLPGFTATGRLESLIAGRAARESKSEEQVAEQMKQQTPMGRFAEPAEIAAAVAFLASPAASYITGVNLPVDGGRIAAI